MVATLEPIARFKQITGMDARQAPAAAIEDYEGALASLAHLQDGWDSYGASAIDRRQLAAAARILATLLQPGTPRASLVPTSRGGVQIEWHAEGIDLEIETLPGFRFAAYFYDDLNEQEWERELASDWTPLAIAVTELTRRRAKRNVSRGN